MNSHAKDIWKAWVDEKEVQYYGFHPEYKANGDCVPTEKWANADPSNPRLYPPHLCPYLWRIKPETKMKGMWYRVYVDISSGNEVPRIAWTRDKEDLQYLNRQREQKIGFIGWITEWIYFVSEAEE